MPKNNDDGKIHSVYTAENHSVPVPKMSVTALAYQKIARETPAAGQGLHRVIKHGVLLGDTNK